MDVYVLRQALDRIIQVNEDAKHYQVVLAATEKVHVQVKGIEFNEEGKQIILKTPENMVPVHLIEKFKEKE